MSKRIDEQRAFDRPVSTFRLERNLGTAIMGRSRILPTWTPFIIMPGQIFIASVRQLFSRVFLEGQQCIEGTSES